LCRVFAFGYYNDIIISGDHSIKYFYLNEDVYQRSQRNFRDVLLCDANGRIVPYVLEKYRAEIVRETIEEFPGEIRQDGRVRDGKREIVLRFREKKSGLAVIGNRLVLKLRVTPPQETPFLGEFISLLGSKDGNTWKSLKTNGFVLQEDQLTFFLETHTLPWYKLIVPGDLERNHKKYLRSAMLQLEEEFIQDAPEREVFLLMEDVTYGAYENNSNVALFQIHTKNIPLDSIRFYSYRNVESEYTIYDGEELRTSLKNPISSGTLIRKGVQEEMEVFLDRNEPHEKIYIKLVYKNANVRKLNPIAVQGRFHPDRIYFRNDHSQKQYKLYYGDENYQNLQTIQMIEAEEELRQNIAGNMNQDLLELEKSSENLKVILRDAAISEKSQDVKIFRGKTKFYDKAFIIGILVLLGGLSFFLVTLLMSWKKKKKRYQQEETLEEF
jgi:hypothetical protein